MAASETAAQSMIRHLQCRLLDAEAAVAVEREAHEAATTAASRSHEELMDASVFSRGG